MAGKQRPTMGKRIREKNKRDKKQAKAEKKAQRKAEGLSMDDPDMIVDAASLVPDPEVYGAETVEVPSEEEEE